MGASNTFPSNGFGCTKDLCPVMRCNSRCCYDGCNSYCLQNNNNKTTTTTTTRPWVSSDRNTMSRESYIYNPDYNYNYRDDDDFMVASVALSSHHLGGCLVLLFSICLSEILKI